MAKLVTLLEQHLDRQPPTVVTQASTWWETVLVLVKLQECGLEVNLPVNVCCFSMSSEEILQGLCSKNIVHEYCIVGNVCEGKLSRVGEFSLADFSLLAHQRMLRPQISINL